jgi:predicted flavoprotein YhiN
MPFMNRTFLWITDGGAAVKKIIVVGGGASGMMAAAVAAREGKNTTLFEKNEKLGKKLFITGKG